MFLQGIGDRIVRIGYFYIAVIAALVYTALYEQHLLNNYTQLGVSIITNIQDFALYGNIIIDSIFIIPVTLLHCYDAAGGAEIEDEDEQKRMEQLFDVTDKLLSKVFSSLEGNI